jgi:hypothetical protein
MSWAGQIYGRGLPRPAFAERPRIYQGTWGLSPYQGLYRPAPNHVLTIALTPEWILFAGVMLAVGLLGLVVAPTIWALLPFIAMASVSLTQALRGAMEARYPMRARELSPLSRARCFALVFILHLLQPAARLWGRLKHGLTPWRRRPRRSSTPVPPSVMTLWSETSLPPQQWLGELEAELTKAGAIVTRGGDYDVWDLRVRGGLLAGARLVLAVEDHEGGKQNIRFRVSASPSRATVALAPTLMAAIVLAAVAGSLYGAALAGMLLAALVWRADTDWRSAAGEVGAAVGTIKGRGPFFRGQGSPHEEGRPDSQAGELTADAAE